MLERMPTRKSRLARACNNSRAPTIPANSHPDKRITEGAKNKTSIAIRDFPRPGYAPPVGSLTHFNTSANSRDTEVASAE